MSKKRLQMQKQKRTSAERVKAILNGDHAPPPPPAHAKTYWNGERCQARIVRVIVGRAEKETFWYAGLDGTEREAVEVVYGERTFYLDNEGDGLGWWKVTVGRGSPQCGHRSLAVERVIESEA